MRSEWNNCNISSLCSLVSSEGTPSRKKEEYYTDGTIKWLKTKELFDTNIYDTEEYISKLGLKNSSAKLYPPNTVIMAMYGATVGQMGIIKNEMSTNQACCCMVADETKVDYMYLFYSLLQNRSILINLANGAAQQNLNSQTIKDFEIAIPSLPTQKKMAHILSTLDDKIELNRKMNHTLEEMAQALFKSWFVDFDPVHVKVNAAGREDALGYKADAKSDEALEGVAAELGISKEVLELFPSEFVESEMGMIPLGWSTTIGESSIQIVDGDRGANYPKTSDFFEKEYCLFLNAKNVKRNGLDFEACSFITKDKDELLRKGKLSRDDIILTTRGTVGNIGYYHKLIPYENVRINSGMVILRCNIDSLSPLYLYIYMKSSIFKNSVVHHTSGTAQPQLPIRDLNKVPFILPEKKIHDEFVGKITPLYLKIFNNDMEINTLKKTRDTLLPKLLSGELGVSNIKVDK